MVPRGLSHKEPEDGIAKTFRVCESRSLLPPFHTKGAEAQREQSRWVASNPGQAGGRVASDPGRAGGVASDRGLTRARSLGGCLAGQTPDATRRRPVRAQLLSLFFPKACVKPLPKQQGHQAHGSHRSRRQRACGAREAGRAGAACAERPAQLAQEARSAPRLGRAKTPVRCDEGGRRGRTQESSRASRGSFQRPRLLVCFQGTSLQEGGTSGIQPQKNDTPPAAQLP